jgi:uncharacterized coiled-coil protein SlyX
MPHNHRSSGIAPPVRAAANKGTLKVMMNMDEIKAENQRLKDRVDALENTLAVCKKTIDENRARFLEMSIQCQKMQFLLDNLERLTK